MSEDVVILTHMDVDGVCSAAIAKIAYPDAELEFAEAYYLAPTLHSIPSRDKIIVMDLGINPTQKEEVLEAFENVREVSDLVYVDHHEFPEGVTEESLPCDTIVHREGISSSELALEYFEPPLLLENIALLGAIGDYQEDTPRMKRLITKHGERISRLETILLEQGLGASRDDPDYLSKIVGKLSEGTWPSSVPGLMKRARSALEKERKVKEHTSKNLEKVSEKVALITDVPYQATGRAATYAMRFADAEVGVGAYEGGDKMRVSMRRNDSSEADLNEIITEATFKLGGTGGGHKAAVGGRIPKEKFDEFLRFLGERVK